MPDRGGRRDAHRGCSDPSLGHCIGILNHLFFWPEQYRRTGGMSIVFLFDENPDVASAGSGGAAVGGARSVPDHAARSNSERAAPSARVGKRFSAPQIVWNKSNRCAGERGGARVGRPRWLRILTITGGSSIAAMIFKLPPQFGQCRSMSKTRLSSLAQLRRALRVIACGRGCSLWWTGNDFTAQLGVGRQHAMEAACPEPVERDQM